MLGLLEEPNRPNLSVACAAETIILALSGFRGENLCGRLKPTTISELGKVAGRTGLYCHDLNSGDALNAGSPTPVSG